jgi:hypothetical protein
VKFGNFGLGRIFSGFGSDIQRQKIDYDAEGKSAMQPCTRKSDARCLAVNHRKLSQATMMTAIDLVNPDERPRI